MLHAKKKFYFWWRTDRVQFLQMGDGGDGGLIKKNSRNNQSNNYFKAVKYFNLLLF